MLSRNRVLAVALLAATAWATTAVADETVKPFDVASEMANQDRIRRDVQVGAAGFSELSQDKRRELTERQDNLSRLIDGRSYAELSQTERMQASSDIDWINKTARDAADNRLVCERTRKSGSNRIERVCTTAREQREAREKATKAMEGHRISPNFDRR
mgnify:CR=1 FL=1